MAPQLQLSTYTQEFRHPNRPRPTSTHRRNNPHPHPDFLLPRIPQTGCGRRPTFVTSRALNSPSLFPPVTHTPVQCPDSKAPAGQSALNLSISHPKPAASASIGRLASKPQPGATHPKPAADTSASTAQPTKHQPGASHSPAHNIHRNVLSTFPATKPLKTQLTHSRPHSKISDLSGGYSCFQVVKPYKAGYYIIHPEFISEWLH